MSTYQVEKMEDVIEEIKPLLELHYKEIALNKDVIALNPDYDKYLMLEELGMLHIVTVRDEGVLIAYYVSFVHHNIHYKDHIFAVNDIMYVANAYRGSTVAYRMLSYAEKELKKLGVSVMSVHMKADFPFERLCEKRGMKKAEYLYTKFIGD